MMKISIRVFAFFLLVAQGALGAEPAAKDFLRYIYGAEGIDLAKACWPSEDAWMLPGPKNPAALAAVGGLRLDTSRRDGIVSGVLGTDMYFIELREGRVDPAFHLDGVYSLHRKLVLMFLYHSLTHNDSALARLTTDPTKVKIAGPKATSGDMDQYGSILESFPVLRASKPSDDAKSRTITYRVPLGEKGLSLTLVKDAGVWKIDTSK